MKPRCLVLLLALCSLVACGQDTTPPPKLFKEDRAALDKAKAVDSLIQQQAQDQQQTVEQQTQ
jgi:hypothetical protein